MFQTLMVRKLFYTIVPNYHTWSKYKKSMNHTSQLFQTFISFFCRNCKVIKHTDA